MIWALLILTATFAVLFLARVGGARRRLLLARWPALLFALAAGAAGLRGALWPALGLAAAALIAWTIWPSVRAGRSSPLAEDPADARARTVLGVARGATEADIRRAYRSKMARAHPDRGGSHASAAALTAARDHLLKALSR